MILVLVSSIIDNFLTGGYNKKSDVVRQEHDSRNEIERILDNSDERIRGSTRAVTMRLQQFSTTQSSEFRNPINQTTNRDEVRSSEMTKQSSNIDENEEVSTPEKQVKINKEQYSKSTFRNIINCFSIQRNIYSLNNARHKYDEDEDLIFLDGMRVLTMCWALITMT